MILICHMVLNKIRVDAFLRLGLEALLEVKVIKVKLVFHQCSCLVDLGFLANLTLTVRNRNILYSLI